MKGSVNSFILPLNPNSCEERFQCEQEGAREAGDRNKDFHSLRAVLVLFHRGPNETKSLKAKGWVGAVPRDKDEHPIGKLKTERINKGQWRH